MSHRNPSPAASPLLPAVLGLLLLAPIAAFAAVPVPPKPTKFVTDASGVLPADRAAALNEKLAAFERETTAQVLVWIAPRVPEGTTPEELGAEAIRRWGVGQEGKDNGVVFFVFTQERKLRIATGYGMEGAIPDVVAKRILADVVKPHLKKGDYVTGVEAGVDAILAAAREGEPAPAAEVAIAANEEAPAAEPESSEWPFVIGVAIYVVILGAVWAYALLRRSTRALVGGCYLAVPLLPLLITAGITLGIVNWRRKKRGEAELLGWVDLGRTSGGGSGGSDSSWSSDSSSSSSSDFSSGGGDSGGGGASDSY